MKIGGKQVRNSEFVQNTRICHTLQNIILKKLDIFLSVFYKTTIVMKIGGKQHCVRNSEFVQNTRTCHTLQKKN